ncbi:MAG: putative glycolipid-binding domain-containing protein [Chloroflexi bacterium]|nr:putative glycolipid-binding domain-containing protein [Chloroflexota bacterium]
MDRNLLWTRWDNTGTELLHISARANCYVVKSTLLGVIEGEPMRVIYRLCCDAHWHMRELDVYKFVDAGATVESVHLRRAEDGRWHTADGEPLPELDGCLDVDLRATPFTNTLPIRRLGLQPGKSAEINVAYVDFPTLEVSPSRQRYTHFGRIDGVQHYKFESLEVDFEAVLPVDDDGIVLDYPGLFRRIQSA